MKQKILIFLVLLLLGAILIRLNVASYTQKPKTTDSEAEPNRSSYNSGATGTQAFYTLLAESGRKVVRWQEPPSALKTAKKNTPTVFVVVGACRRSYTDAEISELLEWVSGGGRLVLVDREPSDGFTKTTTDWKIDLIPSNLGNIFKADPSDKSGMISGTEAAKPGQPTVLTSSVNAIQSSHFVSDITIRRLSEKELRDSRPQQGISAKPPPPVATNSITSKAKTTPSNTTSAGLGTGSGSAPGGSTTEIADAPVAHYVTGSKNIVVDAPYGNGRIVFVSDPYIVSNGGISLVDNAQFAINLVATTDGIIAFDEYHQGFGSNNNQFFQFVAGTPVVAIFLQGMLLAGFIFYSQSRRFARPVPDPEIDRLSKLEYVSAMAELQQRTRAFDLAIENIYRDFRRRASRLLGVDNQIVSTSELATRIAERSKFDKTHVEQTMDSCEQIIFGEPTNKREVLALTTKIREIEKALGMRRRTEK